MGFRKDYEYKLNRDSIKEILELMGSCMDKQHVRKKNKVSSLLTMETILLDMHDRFGDDKQIVIRQVKRMGHYQFRIIYEGDQFDPIGQAAEDDFTRTLVTNIGLEPEWNYTKRKNVISLEIPVDANKDDRNLIIAVVIAVALGFFKPVLPENIVTIMHTGVLLTISGAFMNLLGIFAGLVILFSILKGVCGVGDVADLGKKGKYMATRTLRKSFLYTVIMVVVFIPFFGFKFGETSGANVFDEIIKLLLGIIPSNPITPFSEGNTLQIAFIAVLIGIVLVRTGEKTKDIKNLISQIDTLLISILSDVCRLLPLYIMAALTMVFWEHGFDVVARIWKPLVLCIAASLIQAFISLLRIRMKYNVKISKLVKKTFPAVAIGLTTASSLMAFRTAIDINEHGLGIDKSYNRFALPLKILLHVMSTNTAYIAILYYLAEATGVQVDISWFVLMAVILCLISPAIPPVSGGVLVCMGLLLREFGIPQENLAIAATLIVIMDFITTAVKILMMQMDLVVEADHLGILNKDVMRE